MTLPMLPLNSSGDEAHRDGAVYQLNVSGGYYFDDFLAQGGASTDSELISFITQSITKGIIPMNIKTVSYTHLSVPDSYIEAAKLDGAGYLRIYAGIMRPLCKPALVTLGMFTFVGNWNNFVGPLIYLNTEELFTCLLYTSRCV